MHKKIIQTKTTHPAIKKEKENYRKKSPVGMKIIYLLCKLETSPKKCLITVI